MNSASYKSLFEKVSIRVIFLLIYFVIVNLLSGYIAVFLRFPSLWGNSQIFFDYAMPLNLTWAFAHWPSMIMVSIALFSLPHWEAKSIQHFRSICLSLFLILIYGVLEKIPFALFPAVDLFVAFFFSLIIVPPTYKENPKLVIGVSIFLSLFVISSSYFLYSQWQHRVPEIKETDLMNGLFKLNTIEVNDYQHKLTFNIELTNVIPQDSVCEVALEMTSELFDTYRFDESYEKIVEMTFNPKNAEGENTPYNIGVLEQYDDDGKTNIFCSLEYK